ncbi:MAG: hypothetical protein JW795_08965 [Chitinivibrionales bacterium]|nr:hypothetical protein [Chitinivibrionales bacterium]
MNKHLITRLFKLKIELAAAVIDSIPLPAGIRRRIDSIVVDAGAAAYEALFDFFKQKQNKKSEQKETKSISIE